ncbi:MAG: ABC transporter substrate-binding protein, partial [bacterium]
MVNGFTGDYAPYTAGEKDAAQMAVDLVNEASKQAGLSVTTKLFAEDSQSTPTGATEAATKLVTINKVSVLIGTVTTAESIPIAKTVAIPNHVVQFALSTSPLLAQIDGAGQYLFRTTPSDADQTSKLAEYMGTALGTQKTINTIGENTPEGSAVEQAFEDAWTKLGGKIGVKVVYDAKEPSYDSDAAKAVSGSPDGWFDYDLSDQFATFLPALVRTGKWDPARTFSTDNLKVADLSK